MVKFIKTYLIYNAGEIATLEESEELYLIENGIAIKEGAQQPPKPRRRRKNDNTE